MKRLVLAALAFGLAGCASFSRDGGMDAVRTEVQQRIGAQPGMYRPSDAADTGKLVASLLSKPLTAEDAVTVALLNNRQLQAGYAQLGIVEADLVQAGRLANPTLSFARLKGPDGVEVERKLMFPVIGLLLMPLSREIEQRRFEQAQLGAASDVLRIADATRRAWIAAVAAEQTASYMDQVKTAAQAGADLAQRMAKAGNWSALQLAREQAFLADATAELARARQAHVASREKLIRLLGLASGSGLTLPERLPELPAAAQQAAGAETAAMNSRLDLLMAQRELAGLSASLGLTRKTRFINVLDLGYVRNGAGDNRATGYEIELQVPLFDWSGAHVAKAESIYMQAVHQAAARATDARSQVRTAHAAWQSAYQVARLYRDEVVPLKKRISDEQLLRYNGMLISVFELLADAREQVASVNASIEAQRDFWLADAALRAAMTGSGHDTE